MYNLSNDICKLNGSGLNRSHDFSACAFKYRGHIDAQRCVYSHYVFSCVLIMSVYICMHFLVTLSNVIASWMCSIVRSRYTFLIVYSTALPWFWRVSNSNLCLACCIDFSASIIFWTVVISSYTVRRDLGRGITNLDSVSFETKTLCRLRVLHSGNGLVRSSSPMSLSLRSAV